MWLLMSVEQPLIAAVVARLPEPEFNLAAFQLTFSLALLVESPVIMLLTAGTALGGSVPRYRQLLAFTGALAAGLTALHLGLGLSPAFDWIVSGAIGAPSELVEPARWAFMWMLVWSGAIAYRRLWQGIMIRQGDTDRVAWTTVIRLVVTSAICALGLTTGYLAGASLGGVALSGGVLAGAAAAYWLSRRSVTALPEAPTGTQALPWAELLGFYAPLALTSFIVLGAGPVVSFGLGRAPDPVVALAVWPVVMGLLFVFRSGGYAYQEVVVAWLDAPETRITLRRFAWLLAAVLSGGFLLVAASPLADWWLLTVTGLSPELAAAAKPTLLWASPAPGLAVVISWLRGQLVHAGRTAEVSVAVAVNLTTLAAVLVVGLSTDLIDLPGEQLAAVAFSLSLLAEGVVLSAFR